jgi:hypothetical protein
MTAASRQVEVLGTAEVGTPQSITPAGWKDAIVCWQDVREGDVVLMGDALVVAEHVWIGQKPWGDKTTFTAVDVDYRLDNGHLVSSEHHGDRLTAVRRRDAREA